ncbi:UNVERIFIED_CONTAM: Solute carrier family 25 member 36-A, partial [Eudyptes robustus]
EALIHFIGGAVGGTFGTCFTCPLEVIKTRLQSSKHPNRSPNASNNSSGSTRSTMPSTSSDNGRARFVKPHIVRTEGIKALYKGLLPNVIGVAPSKAIYFYTYSSGKRAMNESQFFVPNSAITHMMAAGFAGFVTATAINPVWLVKTRLQLHQGPLTVRNCIRKIYRSEGLKGFYKGVTASYMGISETIIQFVLYEHFRQIIDEIDFHQENTRFANFMLAGAGAKFCACIMTYPHEVVRTRLREENTKAKGFFTTLKQLYGEGGTRQLYRGLSVQLLRSVPNTAITMGAYEVVVYFLHR